MTPIRILCLNNVLSEKLLSIFQKEKDFKVINNLESFSRLEEFYSQPKIDIVLAKVENQQDLHAIESLIRREKDLKSIIIEDVNEETAFEYAKSGIKGYLKRNVSADALKKAIKTVCYKREVWFDRKITSKIFESFAKQSTTIGQLKLLEFLSKREKEILYLVAQGYKNREISNILFISEQTVKTHLYHISEKLGVKDRVNATLLVKKLEKSGYLDRD